MKQSKLFNSVKAGQVMRNAKRAEIEAKGSELQELSKKGKGCFVGGKYAKGTRVRQARQIVVANLSRLQRELNNIQHDLNELRHHEESAKIQKRNEVLKTDRGIQTACRELQAHFA